jgi:hypothetical protein
MTETAPRMQRHPTSANPSRSNASPDALVTVALTSPSIVAVYSYLGGIISRVEFFSDDNLKFEVQCTRAQWIAILNTLKSDDALHLRTYFAQLGEVDRLIALARTAGAWQRPMETL